MGIQRLSLHQPIGESLALQSRPCHQKTKSEKEVTHVNPKSLWKCLHQKIKKYSKSPWTNCSSSCRRPRAAESAMPSENQKRKEITHVNSKSLWRKTNQDSPSTRTSRQRRSTKPSNKTPAHQGEATSAQQLLETSTRRLGKWSVLPRGPSGRSTPSPT